MQPTPRFSTLTSTLAWCLALIPPCLILALIVKYGVDVPHWDDWHYVDFFKKFSDGTLSFADLFAQQSEYRQFFPNLIFVGLGWLTKWNKVYELFVSFALACLVSFNIYRLEKETIKGSRARRLVIYFLSNVLIFSPVQYENWMLGVQIVYFLPVACLTTCMVVAHSKLDDRTKYLLCMCLATVSTFSSVNGILCWLVVLPLLVWPHRDGRPAKNRWLVVTWIAGFVLNVALYLYGYRFSTRPVETVAHPARAVRHFLVLLGKATEPGDLFFQYQNPVTHFTIAWITGLSLMTLLIVVAWRMRGRVGVVRRAAPWLMLGTYSIATAALVTIGRSGFGVEQAFSPRYTTFTVYLPVALVHLLPILRESEMTEGGSGRGKDRILKALAVVVVAIHLLIYPFNVSQMSGFSKKLLQSKACLLLVNVVQDECLAEKVTQHAEVLKPAADILDAMGFLRPGLIKSNRAEDLAASGASDSRRFGSIDSVNQSGEMHVASGWAVWPERRDPPDAILLTYKSGDGASIIFARADTGAARNVFGRAAHNNSPHEYGAWQKTFAVSDLPAGPLVINAWAFDSRTGRAVQLDGTHVIKK